MSRDERHPREASGGSPLLDVVVIGAGQAGLAVGFHLARLGLRFLVLDAGAAVGTAWRQRWDSLQLFTPARYDSLPGLPFPGDPDRYPTRDDVVTYLERYADEFALPLEFNRTVTSVHARDGGYVVTAGDTTYEADQVVVATGPFQVPFVPPFATDLAADVVQMHSVGYRSPADVPSGTVLVVGGGNTGHQIAEELAATRRIHLAVGSRQTPLPQRLLGRDIFTWLTRLGLMDKTVDSRVGRRARHRDVLIGSSARRLSRRHGVTLQPRAVAALGRTVTFADSSELGVDAVVWATGFRLDHSWIDAATGPDGSIAHRRGVTESPGLYLLGLPWQHTRGSALLGWVKDDAAFIAEQIAARHADRPTSRKPVPPPPAGAAAASAERDALQARR